MTFLQFDYLLIFLPLVVLLYHVFRRYRGVNIIILIASMTFYGMSGALYLIPLIFTSLLDFYVALKLEKTENRTARKWLLGASLTANLGLLGFFKYTPWLLTNANLGFESLGWGARLPVLDLALPPGISFYTFQTMSYTIEVYRREMKASNRVVPYLAFVSFWPHLVAGPIMRARNLLHQLETVRPVIGADEARYALLLIGWGLFKKAVLADNFGEVVNQVDRAVQNGNHFPGAGLIFAYAFAGQIYCDFSAYTDIARGSAKLIGVELVRNFNTPYFSASPAEFWRRWHISLSTWLRDYLYISLGGNRFGKLKEYRNLMLTMFLGGLWHGAGALFLLWGIWHGAVLILYRAFPLHEHLRRLFGPVGTLVAIVLMFQITCFGWLLFRAQPDTIFPLLTTIATIFTSPNTLLFSYYCQVLLVLGGITLFTDYLGYRKGGEFGDLMKTINPYAGAVLAAACYFGVTLLAKREGAQFIYFQF